MLRWYLSLIAATSSVRVDMLIRLAIRCPEDAPLRVASSLRQRISERGNAGSIPDVV